MNIEDGIAVEQGAVVSATKPTLPGVGAGAVILIGTWIGLLAGFGDLGILIVKKRWLDPDFYRIGEHFPWIIPLSVLVMVIAPAILVAILVGGAGRSDLACWWVACHSPACWSCSRGCRWSFGPAC